MSTNHFAICVSQDGRAPRLVAVGELDIATAPELVSCFAHDGFGDAEIVLLDLSGVTFIDASGLHALLKAHTDLQGRLRIVPSERCLRVAEMAGVSDRLSFTALDETGSQREPIKLVAAEPSIATSEPRASANRTT
jgi:anti-anti-sigma factor